MQNRFSLILLFLMAAASTNGSKLGRWSWSSLQMPVFQYTAALPYIATDANGNDSQQPEDPYFLLGNYRMTAFAHVSGIFQLMTAERVWARINASAVRPNYGQNSATLIIGKRQVQLVGVQSLSADPQHCQRRFGIGFATYVYILPDGMECQRTLSVRPSGEVNTGDPQLYINVTIYNNGSRQQHITYAETMPVNFVPMGVQMLKDEDQPIEYRYERHSPDTHIAYFDISAHPRKFMIWPALDEASYYETMPPAVFMKSSATVTATDTHHLSATETFSLKPGETKSICIAIGIGQHDNTIPSPVPDAEGAFASYWKQVLPHFDDERDEVIRREMLWNAYVMEASAKYNTYFGETFIPQGSVYSYHYGDNIANRDHLQALLPACYTNPVLARSAILYVLKQTHMDGELTRGNQGYGYAPPMVYKESDQQLYVFMAVAEYLRITHDYGFLDAPVSFYPKEMKRTTTVADILQRQFVYLRDEIGRGPNGLIRLQNSDWSDSFLHRYSPNIYHWSAESHLNSAMAMAVMPGFIKQLHGHVTDDFTAALTAYCDEVTEAFVADLSTRPYAARAYLDETHRFGLDIACIEPHSYLLQAPALSLERLREIYDNISPLLENGERIGLRTRERPMWGDPTQAEDGGIWYSLEYPLALGVASFDKEEAKRLFRKFSFDNYSRTFPDNWVGQWTAPDEIDSSFHREGLYSFWIPIDNYRHGFQGYCSHPHTWPLYCYFKVKMCER